MKLKFGRMRLDGCGHDFPFCFWRMTGKPDKDSPPEWADQASFMATNLSKMLNGEDGTDTVFGKKVLKKLDVLRVFSSKVIGI